MNFDFKNTFTNKQIIKLVFVSIGMFILGLGTTYYSLSFFIKKSSQQPAPVKNYNNLFDTAKETSKEENSKEFNAVLLGSGGSGHSGGGLTDSIIIIHINPDSKKAAIISVPRDLYVPGNRKINAEVSVNGIDSIKSVLQGVTGLTISKYAWVDFNSLIKLIDTMGGIDVDVPKTFSDNFYPIKGKENELCGKGGDEVLALHNKYSGFELEKQFECRYEAIRFEKGVTHVDGSQALKFARSRHGDSDFGRSERQFAILSGIIKKLSTQSPFKSIENMYESLSTLVKTDLSMEESVELFNLYGNPENYDISQIQLTDQNVLVSGKSAIGEYILLPRTGKNNFNGVKDYIKDNLK